MKKITKMPVGLGMNHLEQEIAACQAWNSLIEQGLSPHRWLPIVGRNPDLFATNRETGLSLLGSGLIEVSDGMVKFTPKAIELLKKFSETQQTSPPMQVLLTVMLVDFSFPQTLSTYHEDLEVILVFKGKALVEEDEVRILSVCSTLYFPDSPLNIPAGYEAQNLATGQMGEFLGMCREAARKAAYKIQKAEQAEADAKFEASRPNNAGFVPNPADTKYMNQEDKD